MAAHDPQRQRGVALMPALLVAALAAVTAVALAHAHQLHARQLTHALDREAALQHVDAVERTAMEALQRVRERPERLDAVVDEGACRAGPFTAALDAHTVEFAVEDLGCRREREPGAGQATETDRYRLELALRSEGAGAVTRVCTLLEPQRGAVVERRLTACQRGL